MKTYSGEPKKGCCGPVGNQVSVLKQASNALTMGHRGVAAMYRSIARELDDPKEKEALEGAAKKHDQMAQDSAIVTIPDLVEDEET